MSDQERAVLTVREAGQMLGLSRGATYDAVARGQIPLSEIWPQNRYSPSSHRADAVGGRSPAAL